MNARYLILTLTGIDIKVDASIEDVIRNPEKYARNKKELEEILDVLHILIARVKSQEVVL